MSRRLSRVSPISVVTEIDKKRRVINRVLISLSVNNQNSTFTDTFVTFANFIQNCKNHCEINKITEFKNKFNEYHGNFNSFLQQNGGTTNRLFKQINDKINTIINLYSYIDTELNKHIVHKNLVTNKVGVKYRPYAFTLADNYVNDIYNEINDFIEALKDLIQLLEKYENPPVGFSRRLSTTIRNSRNTFSNFLRRMSSAFRHQNKIAPATLRHSLQGSHHRQDHV